MRIFLCQTFLSFQHSKYINIQPKSCHKVTQVCSILARHLREKLEMPHKKVISEFAFAHRFVKIPKPSEHLDCNADGYLHICEGAIAIKIYISDDIVHLPRIPETL